ncbi:MAG: hypothetical protein KGZ59_02690 [Chitinophagaceae bacterium]|nr:hypothetical protein [Chitinophagaceae bacterium]
MGDDYNILNQIKSTNSDTYKVPEGYFNHLADSILLKIQSKNAFYRVPNNYFDNLSDTILGKIKAQSSVETCNEELATIAPLLTQISKKNVYQVPENYFSSFQVQALVQQKPKIVQFKFVKTYLKYAVAAVIVSVIAVGGLFQQHNTSQQSLALHQQVKQIDIEKSINHISDQELNQVLEEEQLIAYQSTNKSTSLPWTNLDNLDEELKYVTDEEIDSYFKENNISIN